ncbi:hypothetical protein RB653_008920 [Dictyostelium firmibasis]|uniref:Uncharacterized protein n=1 Tax=Dictyostelium firmibasis TaxID=79012 RepID=A0AAN7U5G1_9MYCE
MISNSDYEEKLIKQQQQEIQDKNFLIDIAIGYTKSIALSIALKYKIPQLLEEKSKSCKELSNILNVNCDYLYRLMRSLSTIGVFIEDELEDGVFRNSRLSKLLTNSNSDSWVNNVYLQSHPNVIQSFMYLEKSIECGISQGMTSQGFTSAWELFEKDKQLKTHFHNTMTCFTSEEIKTILKYIDFNQYKTIVDLGGSSGELLKSIAKSSRGELVESFINFDLPLVINQNKTSYGPATINNNNNKDGADEIDSRYSEVASDFFGDSEYPRADCYTLKFIFHMFNDDKVLTILEKISKSIKPNGKVYVFDHIVQPKNEPSAPFYFDLQMVLNFNGRERSKNEWRSVFEKSSFKIDTILILSDSKRMSVIELSLK